MLSVPSFIFSPEKKSVGSLPSRYGSHADDSAQLFKRNIFLKNRSRTAEKKKNHILKDIRRTSLVVQWLRLHASNAGGPGSIPG